MVQRLVRGARNRFRRLALSRLTRPRPIAVPESNLKFYVHSSSEDMRVRSVREPWTVDWLRALPAGARLFDIGANIGITALLAAERIDRSVDVVAVEPFPANYASLVKNISLNGFEDKIIAMPVGVGSKTEISQYNWASAEAGAALHSFGVMIRPRTGQTIAAVSYHRCLCYRLDDLVRIPGLGFPSHLKIDVDGSELDVLAGAESVLADPRCVGVQIEANERHDGRKERVSAILSRAGFQLLATREHDFPGVVELQFSKQ